MRPALKPGLLPVWRNRDTVQIGIDPRRGVALTGMRGAAALIGLLDGSRDRVQVLAAASELGIEPAVADRVIALLAAGGALADVSLGALRDMPAEARGRLAAELATATLAHGDSDGGACILARRQAACIRVHSTSPAGFGIASLLSAAGIGLVISTGLTAGQAHARHPAGPPVPQAPSPGTASALGPAWESADSAAAAAHPPSAARIPAAPVRGARAGGRPSPRRRPDLVILADSHGREFPAALVRRQIPHLAVCAGEAIGVLGPLVVPGRSACLRCLDMTRAERDPAWPLILAQLASRTADPPACGAVLATAVAAHATAQALAFIDRGATAVAVVNGTIELVLPDWQWKRRSWQPHPRCNCGTCRTM
jgi:hypothetical protein